MEPIGRQNSREPAMAKVGAEAPPQAREGPVHRDPVTGMKVRGNPVPFHPQGVRELDRCGRTGDGFRDHVLGAHGRGPTQHPRRGKRFDAPEHRHGPSCQRGERGGTDVGVSHARPPRPQRPEGKDEDEPHGRTESRTRAPDQHGPDPHDTEGEDEEAGRRCGVRLVQPLQEDP